MDLEVRRDDLRSTRLLGGDGEAPTAGDGEAVLRVARFALTSNNVTYAVFGDAMGYWRFFPAGDGFGRVPVWGFADVVASAVDGVAVGDRVYGYLPMSTHLVVRPVRVGDGAFADGSAHRAELPPTYNRYLRVEPSSADEEGRHALLQPLFGTAFLLDDWLEEQGCFGASRVVLGSASSKTALGLAHLLSRRDGIEVLGLTSAANAGFVASVGSYDAVVAYDDIGSLSTAEPTVFVDMAGGGNVLPAVHRHLAGSLAASCQVGATHWDEAPSAASSEPLPGPAPQFFFAPDRVTKRRADWGPGGLEARLAAAERDFHRSAAGWLRIDERVGLAAAAEAWRALVDGAVAPDVGCVVVLDG